MTGVDRKSRRSSEKKKKHIDPMQYVLKKPEEYRSRGIQKWAWNRRLAIMQKAFGYRFHNLDNLPLKGGNYHCQPHKHDGYSGFVQCGKCISYFL